MRPGWNEYFLSIVKLVAQRSTCLRRKVGALIVKDKRILCTGYNGAPSGLAHCADVGCLREKLNIPSGQRHELCRGLHAEMNAFLQAARYGISLVGGIIYCTNYPCIICAKMIINAGIKEVIILADYPDQYAKDILAEAGIEVKVVQEK
ncbi:MAG: cytidine deaminase [Candidatus Omnitrophota bacterium]|nr:MAG: cytidine deaminase [Candidatus Omnitrophota bacterium]